MSIHSMTGLSSVYFKNTIVHCFLENFLVARSIFWSHALPIAPNSSNIHLWSLLFYNTLSPISATHKSMSRRSSPGEFDLPGTTLLKKNWLCFSKKPSIICSSSVRGGRLLNHSCAHYLSYFLWLCLFILVFLFFKIYYFICMSIYLYVWICVMYMHLL